jgi:hypothetical protein
MFAADFDLRPPSLAAAFPRRDPFRPVGSGVLDTGRRDRHAR